jgi:hypothetical protein
MNKMTPEEAVALLRECKSSQPGFNEAIRTVCDALEGARRAVPVDRDRHIALRDAHEAHSEEHYFDARHSSLDTANNRDIFNAGFTRGFDAAAELYTAAPAQPAHFNDRFIEAIHDALKDGKIVDSLVALGWTPPTTQPAVDVANICNAYESGVGHNGRPTANVNPYPEGSHEHEAYRIGATGTNHKGWPAPETAGDARDAELREELEAIVECLEDDAPILRDDGYSEIPENMERAAEKLRAAVSAILAAQVKP